MFDLSDKELEDVFNKLAGENGKVSKEELKKAAKEKLGDDFKGCPNPGALEKLFEKIDKDGDGELSLEEFKAAVDVINKVKCGMPFDMPPFFKK